MEKRKTLRTAFEAKGRWFKDGVTKVEMRGENEFMRV